MFHHLKCPKKAARCCATPVSYTHLLADLGVKKMVLMTNNPLKINGLTGYGIEIVGREPIEMTCNEKNEFYMYTKYKKMGHMLHVRERDVYKRQGETFLGWSGRDGSGGGFGK